MAHVRKVTRKKSSGKQAHAWQVRYRDPDRVERSRTFRTREEADRFARTIISSVDDGSYVDPTLGKTIFAQWAQEWLDAATVGRKPKTTSGYRSMLRNHLVPEFGASPLVKIRPLDVNRFVTRLSADGMSASRARSTYFLLQSILRAAVGSGYLARSPCVGVKLPRTTKREAGFLTDGEVHRLTDSVPDRYRALIYVLAYGGLRWGEAAALRRKRMNLLRRRIEVTESLADVDGTLYFGPTKTHQARQVALPASVIEVLAEHLSAHVAKGADALVFTSTEGAPLRLPNFRRRVWESALAEAGLGHTRIHDLRHTCAALLIAQGAHAKAIQRHLGHSSIQITFDTYGHLLPDEQDRVAEALDETFRSASRAGDIGTRPAAAKRG